MRLRQLSDLQSDLQYRADIVGGTVAYPLALQTELLNQGWARIYGILTETGEDYYRTIFLWSTAANQDTYYTTSAVGTPSGTAILPTDMYKVKGLDAQLVVGPDYVPCERYEFEQRNDWPQGTITGAWPIGYRYEYANSGANASIRLRPMPAAAVPMRLWYYPAAVRLVNPSDTIDGGNGWEIYAIDWAARRIAEMDQNFELAARIDVSLAEFEARIRAEAANRNAGQAAKVRRVRYRRNNWGGPFHGGGGIV